MADLRRDRRADRPRHLATEGIDAPPTPPSSPTPTPTPTPASASARIPPSSPPPGSRRRRRRRRLREVARIVAAWMLVLPAAAWLAIRAADVGEGTWVETVIVLTPYAAAASVVVLAVVAALRVRPAILAAAATCVGFGAVMAPVFVPGPRPSEAPTGPHLRVMTVNVQYGLADAEQVVRLVDDHRIDLLGVQELTPSFDLALREAGLGDVLPFGVVEADEGAAGTGLYSRHRVRPVGDRIGGRFASPSGLVSVPGAPPVFASVVHPVPPLGDDGRDQWRATLASLPRPGEPLGAAEVSRRDDQARVDVLLGDFNATVDQPTFRGLLDDGYVDAAGAVGRGWLPTWRFGFSPLLAIDHVLVDEATDVGDVTVHAVKGSDHRALVAGVRLPAG
jgi:endonuclease/exonuclease/phosphatase family metal-dependent hydrolase